MKETVQSVLDWGQFRFDTFPSLQYQPIPWLGKPAARRSTGTLQRWDAIETALARCSCATAIDVGCNVGFFALGLARKGIPVLAVDNNEKYLRIARHAAKRMGATNVGFVSLEVKPETTALLPPADAVIFLSVYHHWVRAFGFHAATKMLTRLWERCRVVMFFETGESEMPSSFGLPDMRQTSQEWLQTYLGSACPGGVVKHLGRFKAFSPGGGETQHVVERSLFEIHRA